MNGAAGTDFWFEFTLAGSLVYSNPFASLNDVLRLTDSTPFTTPLGTGNVVDIYFNIASLADGDVFRGAFYTDNSASFLSEIQGATFQYYLQDSAGGITFNGVQYSVLPSSFTVTVDTVAEMANFGSGDISGYVSQFAISASITSSTDLVPEPGILTLLLLGGWFCAAGWGKRPSFWGVTTPKR